MGSRIFMSPLNFKDDNGPQISDPISQINALARDEPLRTFYRYLSVKISWS